MSYVSARFWSAVLLTARRLFLVLGLGAVALFLPLQGTIPVAAQTPASGTSDTATSSAQDSAEQADDRQDGESGAGHPGTEGLPSDQERIPDAPEKTVTEVIEEVAPNDLVRPGAEAQQKIEALKLKLDQLESVLQRENLSDQELKTLRDELRPIDDEVLQINALMAPLVKEIDKRIAELGPAPESGAPEIERLKAERELQLALQSEIYGTQKEIKLISLRAGQLSRAISDRRRILFSDRIFDRQHTLLDASLWRELFASIPVAIMRTNLLMADAYQSLQNRLDSAGFFSLILALLSIVILIPIAKRVRIWIAIVDEDGNPSTVLRKIASAVWIAFAICAIPTVTAANIYGVIDNYGPFNDRVDIPIRALVIVIFLISAAYGLCTAILAPGNPKWRLANLPNWSARRAMILIVSAATIFALDFYISRLNSVLFTPLSLALGEGAVADLLIAILLGFALRTISKGHQALVDPNAPEGLSQGILRWRWVQFVCWIAVLAIPVAQVFGYLSLSQFIATQLVVTGIIMGALALSIMLVDETLTRGIGEGGDESLAEQIGNTLGVQRNRIELTAILVNGLFKLTLIVIAMSFLLVPWGLESKDVFTWLRGAFFGISIGGLTFSMATIFMSILIFFAIIVITRSIQAWLESRFLPHTNLDIGIRTSVKTAFGYLGILLAFSLSLTYLGFDLSSLAIVAGALSLGIGFGLQSIVNNFVSGLILLVERPIKSGDWIVVGSDEGYVRKISVRSTEIQTFDNASVIIPNSDLISGVVTNWMHKDMKGRVKIPIGVGYGSDPVQVQEILLEIAEAHPAVMQRPQPRAYFLDFGASSLDFELRVHLRNIDTGLTIKSELRTTILTKLREANIEIPFPQQDINLKDIDRLSSALEGKNAAPTRRKAQAKPRTPAKSSGAKGK